jgi:hypothetical protein
LKMDLITQSRLYLSYMTLEARYPILLIYPLYPFYPCKIMPWRCLTRMKGMLKKRNQPPIPTLSLAVGGPVLAHFGLYVPVFNFKHHPPSLTPHDQLRRTGTSNFKHQTSNFKHQTSNTPLSPLAIFPVTVIINLVQYTLLNFIQREHRRKLWPKRISRRHLANCSNS